MERFLLKEFAKTPTLQTGVFGSETAGNIQYSENPETIQSLNAWTEGLGSATSNATKQPAINDDQGIYKVLCKAIKNGQISGIPLYLETETYQIGSIVLNIENNEPVLYYSKTSNNIGNSLSDATKWVKYSDIFSDDYTKIDGSNAAFDNLSQTAKENIINSYILDYNNPILLTSSGMVSTANGFLLCVSLSTKEVYVSINGRQCFRFATGDISSSTTYGSYGMVPIFKGDVITWNGGLNLEQSMILPFISNNN